jgi:hypothetical protein
MGINRNALIVPGHGTLFHAEPNTPLPENPLEAFTLTGPTPAGWENLGHTSKDTPPAFGREGGEATKLDTYLVDGVTTIYSAVDWSLIFQSLQVDGDSLDLAFHGAFDADGGYIIPGGVSAIEKGLVLLASDGTGSLLFYVPNTSVALESAPALDAAGYFALPLSASIQAADESVIPAVGGKPGIIKVYKTGMAVTVPRINGSTPSTTAAVGTLVTITGYGFGLVTGAAGVKFGGTNAPYNVVDDNTIVASMPAGAAGSAPIIVTNPTGPSAARTFSRS